MALITLDCDEFINLTSNPLSFLIGDEKKACLFASISSSLYSISKSNSQSTSNDPFVELCLDGFDDEQVWQQIDIFNNQSFKICSKGASFCFNNKVLLHEIVDNKEKNDESPLEENDTESENELTHEKNDTESENEFKKNKIMESKSKTVFEKTPVDDDFFSLRQMEKFLVSQESTLEKNTNNTKENEIDYFNDIPSDDDMEGIDEAEDGFEDVEVLSDNSTESDHNETTQSARTLKYDQYFQTKRDENFSENKTLSKFEKQQLAASKRIDALEKQALEEKDWQMQGETIAANRPVNSLLEEVLSFDHSQRPAPEITDSHTWNLEKIISQRIKDKSWDDVERKIKEIKDPYEFKKNVILNSEKSKLSLQEIYEKEYLAKVSQEQQEDKENPAHLELSTLVKDLFKKLDALSNFHFCLPPPEPEIKVLTNFPSITVEEVQPVTHTEADLLAPEEICGKNEVKGDMEKTVQDKKRARRKKAAMQKVTIEFDMIRILINIVSNSDFFVLFELTGLSLQ